jgi:hypothetical protein
MPTFDALLKQGDTNKDGVLSRDEFSYIPTGRRPQRRTAGFFSRRITSQIPSHNPRRASRHSAAAFSATRQRDSSEPQRDSRSRLAIGPCSCPSKPMCRSR